MGEQKNLIAYYSYSGNTKKVAETIQKLAGGDLFEIIPSEPYPANYNDVVNKVKTEKANDTVIELEENKDISEYDNIFIGTPVWWYTFATPVKTFLKNNNFADKKIIPFCTHGGGGAATTYTDIQKLCPDADVTTGFTAFENSATADNIKFWLDNIL